MTDNYNENPVLSPDENGGRENAEPVRAHSEEARLMVVGVRFKTGGKVYYFDPGDESFVPGDNLIIDTSRGLEFGECASANHLVAASRVVQPLRPVVRRADERDMEILAANAEKEARAFGICQQKIAEHGLEMKLVRVEYSFDGGKILFFFTSDGRVDFRELVKSLASVFRTRIELRQIGVRDEAKMLGGLGICGRPFCCSSFLEDFQPVSIKMAKTQGLSLNPTKISGTCGRLMCCLKHEQEAYEELIKTTPKLESLVETPDGQGTVTSVSVLRCCCRVRMNNDPDSIREYKNEDLNVLRSGRAKPGDRTAEAAAAPAEQGGMKQEKAPVDEFARLKGLEEDEPVRTEEASAEKAQQSRPRRTQKGGGQRGNEKRRGPEKQREATAESRPKRQNQEQRAERERPAVEQQETGIGASGQQNAKHRQRQRRNRNYSRRQKPDGEGKME